MSPQSAGGLIDDADRRREIEREAQARVERRAAYRWAGRVLFWLACLAVGTTLHFLGYFPSVPYQAVGAMCVGVVALAILSAIAEIALARVFRGSYETELWKVMAEHGIPICVHCGYSLAGTTEPRCPECGVAADPVRK